MRFFIVIVFIFKNQIIPFFSLYSYCSPIIRIIRTSIRYCINYKNKFATFF